MKYQRIYDNSPIFIQNIMASLYGYKAKKRRYGYYYRQHIDQLKKFTTYSKDELEEYQVIELKKLLNHTLDNSKFYRELYKDIDINKIQCIEDLRILPLITKEMLRKNIEDVLTIPKAGASIAQTGGTTGKSLTVYNRLQDSQKRMAVLDYFKLSHGFENIKMKRATFNGKHIVPPGQDSRVFWRYNSAIKQMVYSSFHITEENIPFYIESLNEFKPESIDGFISSISEIANYVERNNVKLKFTPIAIFPTAETVTLEHREVVEKVFGCKIRDQYASSEGAPFVWECECGKLHYDITTGVIEKVNDTNEIVVTSFLNYGTPLIRYKIGDSMVFEEKEVQCECGYNTPLIKSIQGRAVDYLYSTSGAKVNLGNVSNIFKSLPSSIVKSQIIQNELTHLIVKLVVDDSYIQHHSKILLDEIKHKFGKDMRVDINIVNDIPREKSGKYKLVVNNIRRT